MLVLGFLLLAATGTFTGLLIADNVSGGPDYTVTVLGNQVATMDAMAIFLSGIVLALVFCLALALAASGAARTRGRTHQLRRARAQARQATADRDALQDRMDETPLPTAGEPARTTTRRPHRVRRLFEP